MRTASGGVRPGTWCIAVFAVLLGAFRPIHAADQPQWGEAWTRNQVSSESGLPDRFDPRSGDNVRWAVPLGGESHSTPVVSGGRVYIGTDNANPRDTRHRGDRGVLYCLDEATGALRWQLVVPKRHEDPYFDWPNCGIASPATVEGDRVYVVTNRGEVACLDADGLADGNDGPFTAEGWHMTAPPGSDRPAAPDSGAEITPAQLPPPGSRTMEPGPLDADIIWLFDLVEDAGIWPHDGAHSSVLVHGDHLYLNTGTGVDNTHRRIRRPEAPALVVLDKHTGRMRAREREGIAASTFHCNWSAPAMAEIAGRDTVVFAGGDGIVYGFEPLPAGPAATAAAPATLNKLWSFDIDPGAPKQDIHRYVQDRRTGPSNIFGVPVVHGGKVFVAGGGDLWWGKNEAWLISFGSAEAGGSDPAEHWRQPLGRHVMSSPAVAGGLAFIADTTRTVHCFDAASGEPLWSHEGKGEFWASPYVADGKVYIGSRRGDFWVFAAQRDKRVLAEIDLGSPISATAVAANGILYVASMDQLIAVGSEGTTAP